MMRLSFITDEATQDFEEAIFIAECCGMQALELRSVENTSIDQIPEERLRRWRSRLDESGLTVCALSSSFFKCREADAFREYDKLVRLCDAADILGCQYIRGFAFFSEAQGAPDLSHIVQYFKGPLSLLRQRGKLLLLEADPGVNTTNHRALAELLEMLNSPQIMAVYDPGNDLYDPFGEQPFPEAYEVIRPYLAHIHIKDAVYDQTGHPLCVCAGQGLVDYPVLLRRLIADGYDGFLSLEPHYRAGHELTEEQMRMPGGTAFTEGGIDAVKESSCAIRKMLKDISADRTGIPDRIPCPNHAVLNQHKQEETHENRYT